MNLSFNSCSATVESAVKDDLMSLHGLLRPEETPNVGMIVVCVASEICKELGVYCNLPAFPNCQGFVPVKELCRFRKVRKHMQKMVRVGQSFVAQISSINKQMDACKSRRNYWVDLSKKNVTKEEEHACIAQHKRAQRVKSILLNVARKAGASPLVVTHTINGLFHASGSVEPHTYLEQMLCAPDEKQIAFLDFIEDFARNLRHKLVKMLSQKHKNL